MLLVRFRLVLLDSAKLRVGDEPVPARIIGVEVDPTEK